MVISYLSHQSRKIAKQMQANNNHQIRPKTTDFERIWLATVFDWISPVTNVKIFNIHLNAETNHKKHAN